MVSVDVKHHVFFQYPNLSEGADRVGGQLRGDKECPVSRVTKSGRVWRKVPESDARSVGPALFLADTQLSESLCAFISGEFKYAPCNTV